MKCTLKDSLVNEEAYIIKCLNSNACWLHLEAVKWEKALVIWAENISFLIINVSFLSMSPALLLFNTKCSVNQWFAENRMLIVRCLCFCYENSVIAVLILSSSSRWAQIATMCIQAQLLSAMILRNIFLWYWKSAHYQLKSQLEIFVYGIRFVQFTLSNQLLKRSFHFTLSYCRSWHFHSVSYRTWTCYLA